MLAETVRSLDAERSTGGNYAFYLSIPPKAFPVVVKQLKRSGLSDPDSYVPPEGRRGRIAGPGAGWSSRSRSGTT